jgi:hypothetical protein
MPSFRGHSSFKGDIMEPRCPLCGAGSTWVRFGDEVHNRPHELRNRFPDDCSSCKNEDRIHWKQWEEGIDVTQFGGKPFNANTEVPGDSSSPHFEGVRIA